MHWIMENAGTVLISAGLAVIVILILRNSIRRKKRGQSGCGCGCNACPSADSCRVPPKQPPR